MILHSITVENWRCLLEKNEIGPFSDRVNILYAPNATGKSTLFEALRCALMDNHTTRGEDFQKLRPWGRDLSPRVTVEFSVGEMRYRVRKGFLDKPESLLERMENGEYSPLAEGPHADAMTRNLFTRDVPKRGMSRPEHWGILQVLWAPQGGLELGELSGNLLSDIRQSLSAQVIDDQTRGVETRLLDRYAIHFTPTGKRKDSGVSGLIERAREDLGASERELLEAESVSEKVKELSKRVATLRNEIAVLRSDHAAIEAKATEYSQLTAELERRTSDARTAESEYGRLKAEIDRIEETTQERDSAQRRLSELDASIPKLEAELEDVRARVDLATRELEAARNERTEADEFLRQCGEAGRFVELREKLRLLEGKIRAANDVRTLLTKHENEKASGAFPDLAGIRKIRKAYSDLEKAKVRLESSLITLEIEPAVSCSGRVETGGGKERVTFEAGKATRVQGAPEVRIDVESFGSIRAFGPCDSAEEAREEVAKAERNIGKLTSAFGKSGKSDIEDLFEEGASLDRHIERGRAELNGLLGNDTLEELVARRDGLNRDKDGILARFPEWEREVPDAKERMCDAAERKARADERVRKAEECREAGNESLSAKNAALLLVRQQKTTEEKHLKSALDRLGKLEGDGKTIEQRRTDRTKFLMSWDSANEKAGEYRKKLEEYGGNPVKKLEKLLDAIRRKEEEHTSANEDLIRENALLDRISPKGVYSTVAVLEERLAELERQHGKEQLEAEAIRLLHDTYGQCRSELSGTVTRKATEMASGIYSRIVGSPSGDLILEESLKPAGFLPRGIKKTVDVNSLSGGEKEQLHFAVRLALATTVGNDERQLLVLDDAFMATDPVRFRRILEIIDDAAQKLQILILTCHPERFMALPEATRFDLEDIRGRLVEASGS